MADAEQVKLAAETYIYGYPLVYGLEEVANGVEGGGALPMQAPYNRYYVLQFIGAWTNNFAYIGRRATGTAEGEYLPTATTTVRCPTG